MENLQNPTEEQLSPKDLSGHLSEHPPEDLPENPPEELEEVQQPTAQVDVEQLLEKITSLEEELAQQQEKQLRILAEADNVKRRATQELDKSRKFALESFVKALLPVLDSFSSAKNAFTEEQVQALEGIELIEKNLLSVLHSNEVEAIVPEVGEEFNPDLHQAMTMVAATKEIKANQVVEVFQRGFLLQDRLLRPALVVVSQ